MIRNRLSVFVLLTLCIALVVGCAGTHRLALEGAQAEKVQRGSVIKGLSLEPQAEDRILALNPERISEADVAEVLGKAPAPRVMLIHGGIVPVHLLMKDFAIFLIGMGYPEASLRNPGDEAFSWSCYESSERLAGYVAWFYEHEGLRPMIIGHSQGGIQAVKVLHELAGTFGDKVSVWNPVTETSEERYTIIDPLTGDERPVVGLKVSFASAVGAGGLTLLMPNQWVMLGRLRKVPDSVDEFTGFYMGFDLVGGDLLGFGSSNRYEPNGKAEVRNVQLPTAYSHVFVPSSSHLLQSRPAKTWINNYSPTDQPDLGEDLKSDNHIIWAADVWHSIKKHWVIELQRLVRAKRDLEGQDRLSSVQ